MNPGEPPPNPSRTLDRRQFLTRTLAAGAAWAVLPGCVSQPAPKAAAVVPATATGGMPKTDRKVNMAFIGIGNRGGDDLKSFANTGLVNVVALCDVDLLGAHTAEARRLFPDVPMFQDFRELFAQAGDRFEAVVIATPDHAHFAIAMLAMSHGKHVYVEKPLAHSFREVELLMAMARKSGVVTQMGNQGHSGNNFHQFKAWTEAGIIKDVTEIVMFMNSPRRWHGWHIDGYPTGETAPATINWDLWAMNAPAHPFSARLHPENWRSWFDYGDGAFGDWGPHILDTAHRFLQLGLPTVIEAVRRDGPNEFIFPQASTIRFSFPARRKLPPCEVYWYDGVDNLPPLPPEFGPAGTPLPKNGKFIYSRDLVFKGGTHGETLRIIPEEKMQAEAARLPRIKGGFSDHFQNFAFGCLGLEETKSPFHISGPLTQVFLLGVIAQRLGGRLEFDPATKRFTNSARANELLFGAPTRAGWESYYKL